MKSNNYFFLLLNIFLILSPVSYAQAPILPDRDKNVYFGLYWGSAGISLALLKLSQFDRLSDSDRELASNLAKASLESIWENRIALENGTKVASWPKYDNSAIYPGIKYGSAGIAQVFIDAYKITNEIKYLDWAQQAIIQIYQESLWFGNLPQWAYSYSSINGDPGIFITDLSFGSLGIIDTTLNLYNITRDSKTLNLAINATEWLYNVSFNEILGNKTGRIIPWYQSSIKINNTFTTYTKGNAGALNVLSKIGLFTNNSKWLEWVNFIAQWIIENQLQDGSWYQESHTVTIEKRLDLEHGISGTILGLIEYKSYIVMNELDNAITEGLQYIFSKKIKNSTNNYYPTVSNINSGSTDLLNGQIGILKTIYNSDLKYDFNNDVDNLLENAFFSYKVSGQNLTGLNTKFGISQPQYSDLSYGSGLAGVVLELINLFHVLNESTQNKLIDLTKASLKTFKFYINNQNFWPRQINLDEANNPFKSTEFYIILLLSAVTIVILLRRKNLFK